MTTGGQNPQDGGRGCHITGTNNDNNDELWGTPGNDRLYSEAEMDGLDARDGLGGELADGGAGRNICYADPDDKKVRCF